MKEPFIYDEISTESSFDQFLLFLLERSLRMYCILQYGAYG